MVLAVAFDQDACASRQCVSETAKCVYTLPNTLDFSNIYDYGIHVSALRLGSL